MDKALKVLTFDIETFPMLVYIWQLGEQRVNLEQVKDDWSVCAFAAKWLGEKQIIYRDTRKHSELSLLIKIWNLLDEADIVITQNGQKFDSRKLNARFIEHKMKPPSPYKHLDTYKIADKVAEFTSHKLEYLTDKLNVKYKKLTHKAFPGLKLWKECMKGNVKAWNEMKKYNIHDVLSTEELYLNLRAWTPQTAPSVYNNGTCVMCGEADLEKRGIDRIKTASYQRLRCKGCGKWQRGEKIK